jgi:hypothetical protein
VNKYRRVWGGLLAATVVFTSLAAAFPQAQQPPPVTSQGTGPQVAAPSTPQQSAARRFTFRATHYEVAAAIAPKTHSLNARVTLDLLAIHPGRTAEFEIHPDLRITNILDAARRPLNYERSDDGRRVTVSLPQAYTNGERTRIIVEYNGPLAENEAQLPGSTRWAYIGEEGSYLLLPARWFPLTDYPANRFTAVFELSAPGDVAIAGTGKAGPPALAQAGAAPAPPASAVTAAPPAKAPAKSARAVAAPAEPPAAPLAPIHVPGSNLYTFRIEQPADAGSFVIGSNQLVPVRAEGLNLGIFVPQAQASSAQPYGEALARIVNFYSSQFGTIWEPHLSVIQLPNVPGTPASGYSAPGVLFLGARQWDTRQANYRLLAQLAARQWWSGEVLPASYNDAWLADGLARYCEALYVEQFAGKEGFLRVLEDSAIGAMAYEDAAPISQAGRLEPASAEYRSVVVNKGAIVFNMLRSQLGDERFNELLRDYYATFRGRSARIADWQALVSEAAARPAAAAASSGAAQTSGSAPAPAPQPPFNVPAFFGQWLNSTGVPEFKIEYLVVRTQKGFKVTGKIKQDLETFRSAVEIKVETDGNPESTVVEVIGSSSDFTMETFGRPKPGAITLDPNNYILKASPRLRVRAAIARGEALAEEGKFYEAVQQYQGALELMKNSSLAHFRMAEAFFFQKNLQASANAFRDAIDGDRDPKWIEVWSHIYLGKIFDITGQRERAVNEYQKAVETNDDTGGAQAEAEKYLREPYKEGTQ